MGCFSFICQISGEPILSNSFSGDAVHLFLLENGKVIEHMFGNYDSYGRVFSDEPNTAASSLLDYESYEWRTDWGTIVDWMCGDNPEYGIAAILEPYWKEGDAYPTVKSSDDPHQGWGHHAELLGSFDKDLSKTVDLPFHKIVNTTP